MNDCTEQTNHGAQVSGVGLATAGVVNGAAQVVRGVVNTPEAIHQGMVEGKEWDPETRQWKEKVLYNLEVEAAEVESSEGRERCKRAGRDDDAEMRT